MWLLYNFVCLKAETKYYLIYEAPYDLVIMIARYTGHMQENSEEKEKLQEAMMYG